MNREDIIRMAREAGCIPRRHPEYDNDIQVFATPDVLERFAALVAAAERESVAASSKRDLTCVCGAVWDGEQMVHAPRKREWVGLTKEEIAQGPQEVLPALYGRWGWAEKEAFEAVVAWAEAKLREKNT